MNRPIVLTTVGDLCTRCDEPARWATSFGHGCNLHAATDHVATPDTRHPALIRIEAAARLMSHAN